LGAAVNASQRHYPMSEMRPALQLLAAADTADAGAGIILEYTNRVTGGPVMPTIACHMQLCAPVTSAIGPTLGPLELPASE
jgi:gentisate 1,2-dioxygenase